MKRKKYKINVRTKQLSVSFSMFFFSLLLYNFCSSFIFGWLNLMVRPFSISDPIVNCRANFLGFVFLSICSNCESNDFAFNHMTWTTFDCHWKYRRPHCGRRNTHFRFYIYCIQVENSQENTRIFWTTCNLSFLCRTSIMNKKCEYLLFFPSFFRCIQCLNHFFASI